MPTEVELSIVAPAHDEEENLAALVEEVERAVAPLGLSFELLLVDDGSTDGTRNVARSLLPTRPWLRCISLCDTPPGRGNGQSAAFHAGFRAARGRLVASLDADLQNDPADLPRLLEQMEKSGADLVQGDRSTARQDNAVRRFGSWVGRVFRHGLLGDSVRDTGCSLRLMKRELALRLPLEFAGMHRFIPVVAHQLGYQVVEVPVHHRPRRAGSTKYGLGIWSRALPGLLDLFAVRWMRARRRPLRGEEVER